VLDELGDPTPIALRNKPTTEQVMSEEIKTPWLAAYIITALLWAIYAVKMTRGAWGSEGRVWLTFAINLLVCPIAILWALDHSRKTKSESINIAKATGPRGVIKRIIAYIWPDTSTVKRGTLWLSKGRFYKDRYSSHDLWKVRDVCSSGIVFLEGVEYGPKPKRQEPVIPCSAALFKKELIRSHRQITKREARELGFRS